nr:nucleoporin nup85 [Quercus suber]
MSHRRTGFGDSPSTPNRKHRFFSSNPSTTPAGPPPSYLTNQSTTPAGPPPRSTYGSSFNTANNTFSRKTSPGRRGFLVPGSSPPIEVEDDDDDNDDDDDDERGYEGDNGDEPVHGMHDQRETSPGKSAFMSSIMSTGPRGLKRSRNGVSREPKQSEMPAIVRAYVKETRPTRLREPDVLIIRNEETMAALDSVIQQNPADASSLLADGANQLSKVWRQHGAATTVEGGIGPAASDGLGKATYLASFLLQVHHPHKLLPSKASRPRSNALANLSQSSACLVPRALLDWLEVFHTPFPDEFNTIHLHQPSPADHDRFWDSVYYSIARGKFELAIRLLTDAGWENAATAQDDYPNTQARGYGGRQLGNIDIVIEDCIRILQACPALREDEWDVKGASWSAFRQQVRQANNNLDAFAGEGDDVDTEEEEDENIDNIFSRSARMSHGLDLSTASKKAESKIPFTIHENLKLVYALLLGGSDEILDTSQDWLEASVYLTVWWDGDEDEVPKASMRRSGIGSSRQKPREVDVSPLPAYRRRLCQAFTLASEQDDGVFQVNTLDPVQVGLASAMEDGVEGVISILRTWSLPIATSITEIAALGDWLPLSRPRSGPRSFEQGFSSEDLMVLSHGPGQQPPQQSGEIKRDELLSEYAELLAAKPELKEAEHLRAREGWELAVSVLGRLNDQPSSQQKIGDLIAQIELTDEGRVDKVLSVCAELGLSEQSRVIAERYADGLATISNPSYGSALIYYARAHATAKLHSTLALLTSLCLLHSAAVPDASTMDAQLTSLLSQGRAALVRLSRVDSEAATMLASHISGYASLRRFYELRDQDVVAATEARVAYRPLERKRQAGTALVQVLASAADCIHGGLYDPSVESVVSVDGVLALLGEALPLLGQPTRIFTREQVFTLLRIVEDFATAPGRIRARAEDLLHAAVKAYREPSVSTSGLLKKSHSDASSRQGGLGGSSWDLLAESVLVQSMESGRSGKGGEVQRAWDWRRGLDGLGGQTVGAHQVLLLLRMSLAQEVARGWSGALNWS